jgi:hypothetical protein
MNTWLIPVTTVILAAIFALWRDMRSENRRIDGETEKRHLENQIRFTALETEIRPIAKWFNNGRRDRTGE